MTDFWEHNCPEEGPIGMAKGHSCDWCGATEESLETQEPVRHADWCASVTQLLLSMPPQKAPCNCHPQPKAEQESNRESARSAWVGLTLDERLELAQDVDWAAGAYCEYAEAIEAKLKEKNT